MNRIKTIGCCKALRTPRIVAALLMGSAGAVMAQTTNRWAVVTVQATDPWATRSGDPGAFTIYRTGDFVLVGLPVFFRVRALRDPVLITSGSRSGP